MPTNSIHHTLCLSGAIIALIAAVVAPVRADVSRQYVGSAGAGKSVHLSLVYSVRSVTGFVEFLVPDPVQPDIESVTGTLAGRNLAVNGLDNDTGNVSLKVRGKFDSSPLTAGAAELKGRLIDATGREWPLVLAQVPFGPTGGTIVTEEIKRHGTRRREFEYDARFPQVAGGNYAALNGAIRAFVASSSKGDLKYFMSGDNVPIPGIAPSNACDITYTILEFTPHFVSIDFQVFVDNGGAHPNTNDVTLNYDLDNCRIVSLGELFAAGPAYLHEVAVKTIAVLAKNNDLEYDDIVRGASTSVANYDVWSLTRWGLTFTFNAYQVGAYAVGPQQVTFPLKSVNLSPKAAGRLAAK